MKEYVAVFERTTRARMVVRYSAETDEQAKSIAGAILNDRWVRGSKITQTYSADPIASEGESLIAVATTETEPAL